MNTLRTDDNICRNSGLINLQLKCSNHHHWSLHPALTAICNPQYGWSRYAFRSTRQSWAIDLLVVHLVIVK